jgi:hypothetical protein
MRKLAEVQKAKDLMHEAMEWSAFKWLFQKSTVRETADQAKSALDRLERAVKARWTDEAKAAYKNLAATAGKASRERQKDPHQPQSVDPQILDLVANVVDADNAAESAGMDAANTFDEAERQWGIILAREGCNKAIHAWALREKAIRKAESVANRLGLEGQAESSFPGEQQ